MRPVDLTNITFSTARRGYDRHEVDLFLSRIAFMLRSAAQRYDIDWAKEPITCTCQTAEPADGQS